MPHRRLSAELAAQPISDGNHLAGYLIERSSGRFEAAPSRGSSLGMFNSAQHAINALIVARRHG